MYMKQRKAKGAVGGGRRDESRERSKKQIIQVFKSKGFTTCLLELPGELVRNTDSGLTSCDSDSVGLGWDPIICIFNKYSQQVF